MARVTNTQYWRRGGRGELLLWGGIVAGPLAWAIDLGSSYAVADHACSTGHSYILHLITIFTFLLSIAGLLSARAAWRELPNEPDHESGDLIGHSKFLSLCGQVFSVAFAVIVVAGGVPRWVLPPCM